LSLAAVAKYRALLLGSTVVKAARVALAKRVR